MTALLQIYLIGLFSFLVSFILGGGPRYLTDRRDLRNVALMALGWPLCLAVVAGVLLSPSVARWVRSRI